MRLNCHKTFSIMIISESESIAKPKTKSENTTNQLYQLNIKLNKRNVKPS